MEYHADCLTPDDAQQSALYPTHCHGRDWHFRTEHSYLPEEKKKQNKCNSKNIWTYQTL